MAPKPATRFIWGVRDVKNLSLPSLEVCVFFIDEASERVKIDSIKKAINKEKVDVTTLKQLAISRGGLINDELRKKAWPELLGANVEDIEPKPGKAIFFTRQQSILFY